jgi:hypothetical protein
MRVVYAAPLRGPSHWFRDTMLVALLAIAVFFALLATAVRLGS